MTKEEAESTLFKGLDCAQSVLYSVLDELDADPEMIQRVATGFGSGMFAGETCGAVAGSIMALGIKYGTSVPVNQTDKDACIEKVEEFRRRFKALHGTTMCRELLGADVSTDEGMAKIEAEELMPKTCPYLVADAVNILLEMFDED